VVHVSLAFSLDRVCGVPGIVLAAMGWVSMAAVQADRAEKDARRQAVLEQKARVALWRIDTAMAALLARRAPRPYFVYRSFYPANRSFNRMFNPQSEYGSLIPSPLLNNRLEEVTLHFQFGPDGRLTSPELPAGADLRLAVPRYLTTREVGKTKKQLADLGRGLDRGKLAKLLPRHEPPPVEMVRSQPPGWERQTPQPPAQRGSFFPWLGTTNVEIAGTGRFATPRQAGLRVRVAQRGHRSECEPDGGANATAAAGVRAAEPEDSRDRHQRRGHDAAMDRRPADPRPPHHRRRQGVRAGMPARLAGGEAVALGDDLRLAAGADLVPSSGAAGSDESRMLASLPVRLVLGRPSDGGGLAASPILISLAAAWLCVALAAAAVGLLLWGVMRLARRRAAFVSAVTHELRTPLTTFQMYAEMLAEGMVPDAEQQAALSRHAPHRSDPADAPGRKTCWLTRGWSAAEPPGESSRSNWAN